ncbi:alpha/beta hydrolase family protein [Formosa sp. A9]|uniref:alpha/beta hydrolase family protein n=1 Tax=Formosa sp. A9 TaxID=3442641 RepID=UPI003EB84130
MEAHFQIKVIPTVLLLLMLLVKSNSYYAQQQGNLVVTENDYRLWGLLTQEHLSKNGDYVSYYMTYPSGKDTLYVQNTTTLNRIGFPKGHHGAFSFDNSWFIFKNSVQGVGIHNLSTQETNYIKDGRAYQLANTQNHVAVYNSQNKKLTLLDLKKNKQTSFNNIIEYQFNSTGKTLAIISKTKDNYRLQLINPSNTAVSKTILSSQKEISFLKWHDTQDELIFYEAQSLSSNPESGYILHHFNKTLNSLDPHTMSGFPKDYRITKTTISQMTQYFIAHNGSQVFFPISKHSIKNEESKNAIGSEVEIWHYQAPEVFPKLQAYHSYKNSDLQGFWDIKKGSFQSITSGEHPFSLINEDHQTALVYGQTAYLPLYKYQGHFTDYHLIDLKTNSKSVILKKHPTRTVGTSPSGSYYSYFKDKKWWLYDVKHSQHINISKNIPEALHKTITYSKTLPPISHPVWNTQETHLYLSGQHDVWQIDLPSLKTTKLTDGKASQLSFSVYKGSNTNPKSRNHLNGKSLTVPSQDNLIFHAIDSTTRHMGYYHYTPKSLKPIIFGDAFSDEVFSTPDASRLTFRTQRFNTPYTLMTYADQHKSVLYRSNPHHKNYYWGDSKIIQYTNSNQDSLQGILYYPAQFDDTKQYPLIVLPYEQQTKYYNQFILPSPFAQDIALVTNFTLNGYFVLFPDIKFRLRNLGMSAADCIIAATETALRNPYIDKNALGLIGHSLGGYETNFTITQTQLFKAAISGSGFSELFSSALSIMPGFGNQPELNYYEFGRLRMDKPFFEIQENYLANSPIHQIDKVDTPLLIWFGNDDDRVNWEQGLYMHLALRRMDKENILLIYPNEKHVLVEQKNQLDLTCKIMDWFDYHLKQQAPKPWILNSHPYKSKRSR